MKYIFFMLIFIGQLHAMGKEENETNTFKVWGLVEKTHNDDLDTYKAFLNDESIIYANCFKNGNIRVTREPAKYIKGEEREIKVLENSIYHYLKDLYERQYGIK